MALVDPFKSTGIVDPFVSKDTSIIDPFAQPQEAPGFLDTIRFNSVEGLLDLWKYESIPAGLYQISTGNTKQKQAQEAVSWLAANPDKKDTEEYDQYKKIERLFGYTLVSNI